MTSRQQVIDELARRLGMSEEAVESFLRTLVTIVAPHIPEVPPYFERYFEARIGSLQREIEHLRDEINRRFEELRGEMNRGFEVVEKRFEELRSEIGGLFGQFERRFVLLERWLFGLLIPLLIAMLAAVFKLLISP